MCVQVSPNRLDLVLATIIPTSAGLYLCRKERVSSHLIPLQLRINGYCYKSQACLDEPNSSGKKLFLADHCRNVQMYAFSQSTKVSTLEILLELALTLVPAALQHYHWTKHTQRRHGD